MACTSEENSGGSKNNEDELTVTGEALTVGAYSATLTGYANLPFELGDAEVGIMFDEVESFQSAKKVVANGLDGNNIFTVTATGLDPSTTYYFKSYVQNGMAIRYGTVKSFTTKESTLPAGAVDLGIEISWGGIITYKLYWAKSNLSESGICARPEDYGDYYAWGETEPKDNYTWSTYKFGNYPSPFSKYSNRSLSGPVDNKRVLEPEDDAANVKLGDKWRIPTDAEWTELMEKCTWIWTDNYNGTGVKGRIVTATNGNSIFLPAAVSTLFGFEGYYWSSSLYTNDHNDNESRFVAFGSDYVHRYEDFRYRGMFVRPVYADVKIIL